MSDTDAPWLWIISGCNGSGKTTFAKRFIPDIAAGIPFVNVDELARRIDPEHLSRAARRAGHAALEAMQSHLSARHSFAAETTLSGYYQKRLVQAARSKDWKVGLVFLWIDTPERAIKRVAMRVRAGGHDVAEADIRRRYERGLANLPWYLRIADCASIYDNVQIRPRLLATWEAGAVTIVDPIGFAAVEAKIGWP